MLQGNRNQEQATKALERVLIEKGLPYILRFLYTEKTNSSFTFELQTRSHKGRHLESLVGFSGEVVFLGVPFIQHSGNSAPAFCHMATPG